jgi:hypothetical protein
MTGTLRKSNSIVWVLELQFLAVCDLGDDVNGRVYFLGDSVIAMLYQ